MTDHISYTDAGVDIDEGAAAVEAIGVAVKSTYRPEVVGDLGGFGGLFSAAALAHYDDPVLVSGTDGVGTKLALAQAYGKHDTVGIDLVAMCVNDILCCGAEPLFFLDYLATGKLDAARASEVIGGIAAGCRQAGAALIGGEMAEHPGVMPADDYDLAGFCVGVVERARMVDGRDLADGDVILGLASSGLHSNGYSLVRRVIAERSLDLHADFEGYGELGALLLTPTRIYVKPVLAALAAGLPIKAMAHITGGGITHNLGRCLRPGFDALVDPHAWQIPLLHRFIAQQAGLTPEEALATFNCGIGLALVVAPSDASALRAHFEAAGEQVSRLGLVVAGNGQTVRYQ
ncbi:MAG: phosphoribosylformylglycinamidine cyclo-ligase [Actinomycetia bacterium]|nr:phosphoribosylformylglycinamidine cyclo-ligase [Actinomycetes bacterium]